MSLPLKTDVSLADHQRPLTWLTVIAVVSTAALWGGNPVAAKFTLMSDYTDYGLPPITVSGIRFLLATFFMLIWCQFEKSPWRITPQQLPTCLIAGTLLAAQIGTFTIGVQLSNSTHTTILINTFIIWIFGYEHFVSRTQRMSKLQVIGCTLAAASALVTLLLKSKADTTTANNSDLPGLLGDCIIVISGALLAAKILFIKANLKTVQSGTLMLWHDLIAVIWFVAIAAYFERDQISIDQVNHLVIWGLIYQGVIVGGLCFAIQTLLLNKYSASRITVFSFLTPIFGIATAATLRKDPLSPWIFLSLALVAAGIYLVNRPQVNQ
ncbi:MAG: DMT family transporter [Planctomycetaceae bacterium]|jgi:drug/metabolite transporter (DMT)-like permease|nr:DMT family transporter [Planctomycetaceae bacterium]MBT4845969.1 DMT family transporter [Planctomycetaceae bacterium]MBT5123785.1 DMT family transporter [Planctomycetaceae bacterium]MBT5600521.1 DMT family transporter [Planctomycetaceae bacterium]MBT5885825.1 DMT family transporter [Planctomycetaceae bacterium]